MIDIYTPQKEKGGAQVRTYNTHKNTMILIITGEGGKGKLGLLTCSQQLQTSHPHPFHLRKLANHFQAIVDNA
jgi:hypothetical protein